MQLLCYGEVEASEIHWLWPVTGGGNFGLAATNKTLYRTCLPLENHEDVKCRLLEGTQGAATPDRDLFAPMQASIQAYFAGEKTIFDPSPLVLEEMTVFARAVLKAGAGAPEYLSLTYKRD